MEEKKHVILVRTKQSGDPTEISYQWAESVKQQFLRNNWNVIDMSITDAVQTKVEKVLAKSKSTVFLFYGHGGPDKMIGQNGQPVIDLSNLELLKNHIVYAVACWTARILGVKSVNIARCYEGYDKELVVFFKEPFVSALEKCVNKGILLLLGKSKKTIEQARQETMEEYSNWIDYFTIGDGSGESNGLYFAAELRHNRDALVPVLGDNNTTF